jgi:hypothetical protein
VEAVAFLEALAGVEAVVAGDEPAAGAYRQDVIAPQWVVHGFEFGDVLADRPDEYGYVYNYIDYGFAEDGVELRARHYLDEPGRALVMAEPSDDPFMQRVLIFLAMRYANVEWLERGRYGRVAAPFMEYIRSLAARHMREHAD